MTSVLVKGVHSQNTGALLMLETVQGALDPQDGSWRLVLPTASFPYLLRKDYRCYQHLSLSSGWVDLNSLSGLLPRQVRKMLASRFGLVTEKDVDVVLDCSGFAYGDAWPVASTWRLYRMVRRIVRRGGMYVLMPQAFGPFTRTFDRMFMRRALSLASAVYARDEKSRAHLAALGVDAELAPDFTCLVHAEQSFDRSSIGRIVPNTNVKERYGRERYEAFLVTCGRAMSRAGLAVSLLNHEGPLDEEICVRVRDALQACGVEAVLESGLRPAEAKRRLASSAVVVSSRYHASLSALASGVVCFSTSWSHKYEELYHDWGLSELLLSPDMSTSDIGRRISSALRDRKALESTIAAAAARHEERASAVMENVRNRIDTRYGSGPDS